MHTAVDLFAGPGGLDLAAQTAGLNPAGIEHDPDACATRRMVGLPTIEGDVRRYGPADFPDAHTLLGGPPCQTFSATGTGTGRAQLQLVLDLARRMATRENIQPRLASLADERTGLVLEPLRWVLEAVDAGRPYRTVVLEQVPQVLPVWQAYRGLLEAEGYTAVCEVLRAEQYGVPQTRRRAVLVARLDGPAVLPAPTHRPYQPGVPQHAGNPALLPWRSMADVLPHRGPFTAVSNYGTGGDPRNRGQRSSAEPAFTVTGKISRLRLLNSDGTEQHRLTPAEAGTLQSFPPGHLWSGRNVAQQIGNAAPPALFTAVLQAALAPAPVPV